jgi:hypothetical protein
MRELLDLLQQAGHSDFRDARGPLGLTQRQAAGKFTTKEADAFIEGLQNTGTPNTGTPHTGPPHTGPPSTGSDGPSPAPTVTARPAASRGLRRVPTEDLAAELQRRGWTVTEPPSPPSPG